MILDHERVDQLVNNIVAQPMDSLIVHILTQINIEIQNVPVAQVGGFPHLDPVFRRFCRHVLTKRKPTSQCDHTFINGNIFSRLEIGFESGSNII